MTLQELADLGPGMACLLAVVMTLVQLAPIKVNPWSWIANKVGGAINKELKTSLTSQIKDLKEKVDDLEDKLTSLTGDVEVNAVLSSRSNILHFGDELVRDPTRKHTKEHFEQILQDCDKYENYCRDHPDFENNQAVLTIERIKEIYSHCLRDHDFL